MPPWEYCHRYKYFLGKYPINTRHSLNLFAYRMFYKCLAYHVRHESITIKSITHERRSREKVPEPYGEPSV